MLVGYRPGGAPVAVNDSRNPFDIRTETSEGDWHWTIGNTLQNNGLPRYGFYNGEAVRYQYLVVEKNAYTDTDKATALNYLAVLPAVWDGINFGTAGQIIMFDRVIAQDQDRLVNIKSANLEIEKVWNGAASAQQVYVKIYRTYNGDFDVGLTEDYTNMLNTSFDEWLSDHLNKKAGILSSSNIYTPTGSSEKYIVLKGNETITIQNIPTVSEHGAYRYWIEEVGYRDSTGDHFYKTGINTYDAAVQEVVPYTTEYTVNADANRKPFNNDNRAGAKTPVIFLNGTNHFTITNTSDNGALQIIKTVTAGNEADAVGVPFEFTVNLTIPSGKTLEHTDLTISGGTIQNDFVLNGSTATFTVVITGAGTATISGIPFDTSYTVVEKTPLPTGWEQVEDAVYSDTGNPKTVATTDATIDTVTITNTKMTSVKAKKNWADGKTPPPNTIVVLTLKGTVSNETVGANPVEIGYSTLGITKTAATLDGGSGKNDDTTAKPWEYEWIDLPNCDQDGNVITYTVEETSYTIDGEDRTAAEADEHATEGYDFSFTNDLPTTERHAVKIWEDADDAEHLRPTSITFTLVAKVDGTELEPEALTAAGITMEQQPAEVTIEPTDGVWPTVDWVNLPMYTETGAPIEYSVTEAAVENYSSAMQENETTVTFTNTLSKISIDLVKVRTGTDERLSGAVFQLQREYPKNTDGGEGAETSGTEFRDYRDPITVTDAVEIGDLPDGNYRLIEKQAPTGFIMMSSQITFSVQNGEISQTNADGTTVKYSEKTGDKPDTLTIGNTAGVELPATGGTGTVLYTFLGLMILLLAGGLLVFNKRRGARENK